MFYKYFSTRKCCFQVLLLIVLTTILSISLFDYSKFRKDIPMDTLTNNQECMNTDDVFHKNVVDKYYEGRKNWTTSNLGTIMFKNVDAKLFSVKDKTFLVMVWKKWQNFIERHVSNYDPKRKKSLNDYILANCSVKNCKFTSKIENFYKADAVVMTGEFIPKVARRNLNQRWIFYNEDSPMRATFLKHPYHQIRDLANVFNWTMTYRSDADIPIPFGRTVPLKVNVDLYMDSPDAVLEQIVPFWSEKQFSALVNILISNCNVKKRMDYIDNLKKYMRVDVFGNCSDNASDACPGIRMKDCILTKEYLFYLVIEPASCRQYITEKVFHHAYSKGSIPIIMGPPEKDCKKLLPPDSFIHTSNYKTAEELAKDVINIANNFDSLLQFHSWRLHFSVQNELGYFGTESKFFCRICEALNFNDGGAKVYSADDLELFFERKVLCDVNYV